LFVDEVGGWGKKCLEKGSATRIQVLSLIHFESLVATLLDVENESGELAIALRRKRM
jgi:hypothetical protein